MSYQIFFDPKTFTFTYIIFDQETKKAAILDSVLDFDPKTQNFSSNSADKIIEFINKNNLKTQWILETHIHADHISAARYLKEKLYHFPFKNGQYSKIFLFDICKK